MDDGRPIILLDQGWDQIMRTGLQPLEGMLEKGMTRSKGMFRHGEYLKIYTVIQSMCCQQAPYNWSAELYVRHGEYLEKYLRTTVLTSLQGLQSEHLLVELVRRNDNHQIMNRWLRHFFMYLDRFHVEHNSLPTLLNTGLTKFKHCVFDVIKSVVCDAILALIDQERDGVAIDRTLADKAVKIFELMGMGTLDVYEEDLEKPLITATHAYYQSKSITWLETDSTPAYLVRSEIALEQETQRVRQYLSPENSEIKLINAVKKELLEKREQELLEKDGSGCRVMLKNDQLEDLARMYRLFSKVVNGIQPMADIFRHHVTDVGQDALQARQARIDADKAKENNDDPDMIRELISIHDKYLTMVQRQMGNDSAFQKALKDAFADIMNRTVGKFHTADIISTFCDRILKGKEKLSEEEVEAFLEKSVQLFSYLNDKDVFGEIYRSQLAKRVLNQKSASDDMEKVMIAKLKLKCGNSFTAKMEGMLSDLLLGIETSNQFDEFFKTQRVQQSHALQYIGLDKLDFTVQQLSSGHWPAHATYPITLPNVLQRAKEIYETFHKSKFSGRRLTWHYGLGAATIKGSFAKGKKTHDLKVTTLQAILLLCFNTPSGTGSSSSSLTFQHLCETTGLNDEIGHEVMKRILHSLSCGKERVLKRIANEANSSDKVIRETDSFEFNDNYSSAKKVVAIPMASLEDSHTNKRIETDRSHTIDAAIVRTMKARKTLGHEQLIAEVLNQLAFFKPDRKVIKKRIEALITRDYLERGADINTYNYLA
jgi:cullin 1